MLKPLLDEWNVVLVELLYDLTVVLMVFLEGVVRIKRLITLALILQSISIFLSNSVRRYDLFFLLFTF